MTTRRSVPGVLRGTTREHLYSALIAVACIVVAALVIRVTDTFPDHERVRGELGEEVQLDDVWVTVDEVRSGSVLVRDDRGESVARTPGLFVVMDVGVRAPGVEGGINRYTLHGGSDRTYEPYDSSAGSFKPEAGFEEFGTVYFEIDPADLEGMVLEIWSGSIFTAFEQHLYIDLEVGPEQAAELHDGLGTDVGFDYSSVKVAIP